MELSVTFKLIAYECFHSLQVFLIESLPHQVKDLEALFVRDRAKLECARHVQHSLDDLLAQNAVKAGSVTD